MSFFANPFKRRRQGEEVELQRTIVGTDFAPATPPNGVEPARHEAAMPSRAGAGGDAASSTEAGIEMRGQSSAGQELERAKVRDRAAFFESLIKERTSGPLRSCDSMSGGDSGSDGETTGTWRPTAARSNSAAKAAEAATIIENLRCQLERVDLERRSAEEALTRRSHEVDNLMRVVKELSQSRAAALTARAVIAERYNDLQHEYARVTRIADLSREVSKENLALTSKAREAACAAARDAATARRDAEVLGGAERRAAAENARLRQKVSLLERLTGVEEAGESACMKEFTARVWETY